MPDTSNRWQYQRSVIREAATEMACLRHPTAILESFLMSAQGGTGAQGGFAALVDKTSRVTQLIIRGNKGITDEELRTFLREGRVPALTGKEKFPFFWVRSNHSQFDLEFNLLLACPLEDDRMAVAGLTLAMHGRKYDSQDEEFLMELVLLLQISLNKTLFSTQVELMNAELEKRNAELDRQVFLLNGFRELSEEAGAFVDVEKFLDAFLPTLLGRFFRHQGLVVVQNRVAGSVGIKSMGIEPEPVPVSGQEPGKGFQAIDIDRLMYLCLSGVRNKRYQPLQTQPVLEIGALLGLIQGFEPETAFLFMLKDQMFGAVLMGKPLEERNISDQEKELLFAFISQAVLHLKNADSFHTILSLNLNLEKRNKELQQTIDELTQAEHRIGVLETAAKRVVQMVTQKAERNLRVKRLDFVLLIGISLVLALLFNFQNPKGIAFLHPQRPADAISIDEQEARRLLSKENAFLIDARPREFYELGHAKESINIPPALFDSIYKARFWDEELDRPLIIYGKSISRLWDEALARRFLNQGHERVYLFKKGIRDPLVSGGEE